MNYLLIKLDEGGFELLLDGATDVVDVLGLGQGLAHLVFLGAEVGRWGLGHGVERHLDVVSVSIFLKLDVTDLLVGYDGGVVIGHVPGQFGEVGSHMRFLDAKESVEVVFNCY